MVNNNSNNSNNASCPLVPQAESNEVPTLGGGGRNSCVGTTSSSEEEEYQSPLERLITQSTAEQRGDDFNFNFNHNIPSSSQLLWDHDDVNDTVNNNYNNNNGRMISPSMEQTLLLGPSKKPSSSLVTLMACICCLLQICFIWASFLSSSWLDTRLIVSIYNNDNSSSNNNNNHGSSQLLHSTTLGSLLSSLLGTNRHWTAIALVFTSLILPCLCAISGIMGIIDDRIEQNNMIVDANNNTGSLYYVTRRRLNKRRNNNNNNQSNNNNNYYPRMFLEYIARIGFSIFFILLILDIGTSSSIEIEFNNTSFVFINQIQGGMVVYALGILCTLLVITLLRLGRTTKSHLLISDNTDAAITNNNNTNTQCTTFNNNDLLYHEQQEYFRKRRRNKQQSQDFQYSWQVSSNELFAGSNNEQEEDGNDNMELQTPLLLNHDEHEHNNNNNNNNNSLGAGGDTNFLFISEAAEEEDMFDYNISQYLTGTMPTETSNITSVSVLPFWKRALLYELIVLSILLWLPTLFLPLFRLQYDGIMSDFMSDVSFSVKLWNFPVLLWERGISAGTNRGMLIIIESIVLLLVFICPILANILAICTWVSDTHTSKTYCKNLLWMIQPFLGSIVFGITIYLSIPAFEAVFEYVTDTYSYGLCRKFEIFTTDTCLTIQAQPSMGLYFLLGQALVLSLIHI